MFLPVLLRWAALHALQTQLADVQSELEASNEKLVEKEYLVVGIKVVMSEQLKSLSIARDAALGRIGRLMTQLAKLEALYEKSSTV
jgi:predicted  nucleic acid-binding Zn-ribbon protein